MRETTNKTYPTLGSLDPALALESLPVEGPCEENDAGESPQDPVVPHPDREQPLLVVTCRSILLAHPAYEEDLPHPAYEGLLPIGQAVNSLQEKEKLTVLHLALFMFMSNHFILFLYKRLNLNGEGRKEHGIH